MSRKKNPNTAFLILLLSFLSITFLSCSGGGGGASEGNGGGTTPTVLTWAKTYGGSEDDIAYSVQQTADGSFMIAGESSSFGGNLEDFWIIKINNNGEVVWQKLYGDSAGDTVRSIKQTSDNGYIVVGQSFSFSNPLGDIWILKLKFSGDIEWQNIYRISGSNIANDVQQTSDYGIIVVGETASDVLVIKLDAYGKTSWAKSFGGPDLDRAFSVEQTSDGGFVIIGETSSFGAGSSDIWLLKIDSGGNIIWQKTYGGSGNDIAYSIQKTSDGGYIVVGETSSIGSGGIDAWILKLDSSGNKLWERAYGGSGNDAARSVRQTLDGGFIVVGETSSFGAGYSDFWVLKLDENGNIGQGCSIFRDSNAVISDTSVNPEDSKATPVSKNAIVTQTNISPQDTNAVVSTQCSYP